MISDNLVIVVQHASAVISVRNIHTALLSEAIVLRFIALRMVTG